MILQEKDKRVFDIKILLMMENVTDELITALQSRHSVNKEKEQTRNQSYFNVLRRNTDIIQLHTYSHFKLKRMLTDLL